MSLAARLPVRQERPSMSAIRRDALRLVVVEPVWKHGGCLNKNISYTEASGFFGAAA